MFDGFTLSCFSSSVPQPEQLLKTKLHIPPIRTKHVFRPRLVSRLDESLDCKLTLISAPVGFGKTTLLSEWIHNIESRLPVAWISLDERDNDPIRLFAYIVTAFRSTISDDFNDAILSGDMTQISFIDRLTGFLNTIVTVVPNDFVLVFDDYHVINSNSVHEALNFILDHMPSNMHLVISTRIDPPLPLAQLRARGQLVELRASDLRFSIDEEMAFLNQVMELDLSREEISELETRIEGWIAGIQLAALSLQERKNTKEFIQAFTGTHRHIVDYLTEQVLLQQPKDRQTFLLETSILDRLTGPLCDAITGRTGTQAILEQLEAANLFIVPLDDGRNWYRYHNLFVDYLRSRLRATQPDLVKPLHIRASEWYEQMDFITESIYHSLAAKEIGRAVRLVEDNARIRIKEGELTMVLEWVEALPGEVVSTRPRLCLDYAWSLLLTGQTSSIDKHLQNIEITLANDTEACQSPDEAQRVDSLYGEITLIRVLLSRLEDDPAQTIELSQQALEKINESNLFGRGLLYLNLGIAFRKSRQVKEASRALLEAVKESQKAKNVLGTMISVFNLGKLYEIQGQLFRALETYQQFILTVQDGSRGTSHRSPALGAIYIGMAGVYYEWDDLDAAEKNLEEGLSLGESGGYLGMLLNGYTLLAWIRQVKGDPHKALDEMYRAREIIQKRIPHPAIMEEIDAHQAKLQLSQGDLKSANRWAQNIGLSTNIELDTLGEFKLIIFTRVLLAQRRLDEAQHLVERLLQSAELEGRKGKVIELLTLESLIRHGRGDLVEALAELKRALILAEPEAYIRTFVDMGTPVAELLLLGNARNAWNAPHLSNYVNKILSCFGIEPIHRNEITKPREQKEITVPLSNRELQVLQLVASGASNKEIAQRLSVTLSTVKAHLRSINDKLDVGNRTQAVARARSLHLLP